MRHTESMMENLITDEMKVKEPHASCVSGKLGSCISALLVGNLPDILRRVLVVEYNRHWHERYYRRGEMPEEELVELKFRLYDGSDIGPFRYLPASTVAMLKERILTEWPKGPNLFFKPCCLVMQLCNFGSRSIHLEFGLRTASEHLSCYYSLDKKFVPKAANDIKLISAGKILENSKTVGQCRVPFGELSKGAITMHVVVQPPLTKAKTEKKVDEAPRKHFCSCSIL
ncbi:hypothetical protein JRO89_XS01G0214900 [Xanthoceras sorbifolium]|uniref:UBL3-like ubiquitin domain-containing protein n=1 Tax=Xanthoceras sorbifolium TaxID=99658 RepID=A0ABQ8IKZ9_9ROSI|nr:hypothetical protein JRO89_XS01G0214900 [Xanthoceras sorbifolium]